MAQNDNPIVTSLPAYVEEHRLPLLRDAVIGNRTAAEFQLYAGLKGETALNLLATDIAFGDGAVCGWDDAGTSTLTQRHIKPGYIKINQSFCDKNLLRTWANYAVRIAAGQKTLPFEEDFMAGIKEQIKKQLEISMWQGDTATTNTNVNTNKFDGMIKILAADVAAGNKVTYAAGSSVTQVVNAIYAKLPSAVWSKGEVVLYMGADKYRAYIQELIANGNLVITTVVNDVAMPESVLVPGTNLRVIPVAGLDGTGKMAASYRDNFIYGVDMAGDDEKFEFWYSQDNREFRLAVEFLAGVQVAFPDSVVYAAPQA